MSFDVFASGSGFHYNKDGFFDGDSFDTLQVLNTLMGMEHTKLGAVDAAREHFFTADGADAAPLLAKREFLNSLTETVDLLSTRAGATNGFIAVTAKQKHALWPDKVLFARYGFDPGDNPGTEFVRAISKNLEETGLKNWGVLLALTIVLSEFLDHLNTDSALQTTLNIFLTH